MSSMLLVLSIVMVLSSCSLSSSNDGDEGTQPTATTAIEVTAGATVAPASPGASVPSPSATSTAGPDGGTTLVAPEIPARPPATGDQTLSITGTNAGPSSLDPALVRDVESAFLVRQVFRGLVRFDENLNPVPDLARQVEISADGLVYTFRLWPEITFHDGESITAHDVKFSLDRATDPTLMGGDDTKLPSATFLADIEGAEDRMAGRTSDLSGVRVIDEQTVEIRLTRPIANFLEKLAGSPGMVVNRENVLGDEEWWREPNGSGPFRLTDWQDGDRIVLEGHGGYIPNPPVLEQVTILFGVNAVAPMALYERGEIDLAPVPSNAVERVRASNSAYQDELVSYSELATSLILINPNVAPYDDIDVRRALIQGFDQEKIATTALDGMVLPAAGVVPPGILDSDLVATMPEYDLETARSLLHSVQRENSIDGLTFYTSGSFTPVTMKNVYERDLGLDVEVIQLEWADYMADLVGRQLPLFSLEWVADYPDPESFLRTLFHSDSPDNYIGYSNSAVDQLLNDAMLEPDEVRRAALFERAQQQIIDDAVVIPLFHDVEDLVVKPYLHGVSTTPMGILGLESFWMTR